MQQQHEVALTVFEAQQLRHAEQMHKVATQLVLAKTMLPRQKSSYSSVITH